MATHKVFTKAKQNSLCRTGLEVYKTDEENFVPYLAPGAVAEDGVSGSSVKKSDDDSDKDSDNTKDSKSSNSKSSSNSSKSSSKSTSKSSSKSSSKSTSKSSSKSSSKNNNNSSKSSSKNTKNTKNNKDDKKEDTPKNPNDIENSRGYRYHQGEITNIYYYGNLQKTSHEYDYSNMDNNGSFTIKEINRERFYKGVRVCLKKEWEPEKTTLKWDELPSVLDGYITEQTFSEDHVEVKVAGQTALLDEKFQFEFNNMLRSDILEEIILTAGLVPVIDTTGLDDDVTSFKTTSDSGSSSSDTSSTGSASIDEAVNKAIEGKSDDLSKAKAIDSAFKNYIYYKYYWDCKYSSIDSAWKAGHLNCADGANVLCAMFNSAGLKAVILHVPDHYIVRVTVNGKNYFTDNAANTGSHTTRAFGSVWRGNTSGSVVGTKI